MQRLSASQHIMIPAGDGSTVKPKEARGVAPMLRSYMAHYHAPALLKTATQATVLTVFVGLFFLSIGAVQHISRLRSSGPSDSELTSMHLHLCMI